MRRYLGRGNTVDKADLLEAFLAHGEADLPAFINNLMNDSKWLTNLIQLILHIHVHITPEVCNLGERAIVLVC